MMDESITPDIHRQERQGFPEMVYGHGKSPEQIQHAMSALARAHGCAFATGINPDKASRLCPELPEVTWDPISQTASWGRMPASGHRVAIVSAGTSDAAVAGEAAQTCCFLGHEAIRLSDVGVAGIHRLIDRLPLIHNATVVIAVAGMEGALPSVVGGLVRQPVIAVPTSIGYGTGLGGLAALMSMLNSCAAGMTVVNIDNGFGAAVAAHRIISFNPNSIRA